MDVERGSGLEPAGKVVRFEVSPAGPIADQEQAR